MGGGREPPQPGWREDLPMSDHESSPGCSGAESASEHDVSDEARETALVRQVLRMQEQHREGGVEGWLDDEGPTPEPGTPT